MSFSGTGPLGSFGWGTTVTQALESQAYEVTAAFDQIQHVLDEKEAKPLVLPVDLAAVMTPHEEVDWSEAELFEFHNRKQQQLLQFTEETEGDINRLTESWRKVQREFYDYQKIEVMQLPVEQRNVVYAIADLFSVLGVTLYLREALLYPLVRDQEGADGETHLLKERLHIQLIKEKLRKVRKAVSYHLHSRTTWIDQIGEIRALWDKSWKEESEVVLPRLTRWLQELSTPSINEISFYQQHSSIQAPDPPSNHDLNYGQQLTQMFFILRGNYLRSGFFSGIPKLRHEPDWVSPDGFQTLPDICFGTLKKPIVDSCVHSFQPEFLKKDNQPVLPATETPYKIVKKAVDVEDKTPVEAHDSRANSEESGIGILESLRSLPETFFNSVDKVKTMYESLQTEIEGHINKEGFVNEHQESDLEALELDITPLGSHYLFNHFDTQYFRSIDDYRLKLCGNCCERPQEFSLDQIINMASASAITQPLVMECSGKNRPAKSRLAGCYLWTGLPLRALLSEAGISKTAVDIVFTGYDTGLQGRSLRHYQKAVDVSDPVLDYITLCWQHNGVNLSPQHGYPLRLVTPGWYGDNNVKWLQSIEIIDHKFDGNHINHNLQEQLEMSPRAMLRPIGYPSIETKHKRTLLKGTHTFVGRAWVGGGFYRTVMAVEVSLDNGTTWMRAKLEPRLGVFAWHRFTFEVTLDAGEYGVRARAIDSLGHQQREDENICETVHLVVVDQL